MEQWFSTFFGSRHTFGVKTFGGTLVLANYYFKAPLKISIDKFHEEYQLANDKKIQYLVAPLQTLHGTLVYRVTPVENHCYRAAFLNRRVATR